MQLYRYWIRKTFRLHFPPSGGEGPQKIEILGYSNESMQDAERVADTLFNTLQESIATSGYLKTGRPWDYSAGRPIREEILHELNPGNIVSRNRYGAEVLNSETHVFIDVDFRRQPRLFRLARLLGLTRSEPLSPEKYTLQKIVDAAHEESKDLHPIRLYMTKNGYRLVVQNIDIDPAGKACARLMKRFKADRLYARLCASQRCFRARLTPKPHRIHVKSRRFVWPEPETAEHRAGKDAWLANYAEESKPYAVCHYLDTLNGSRIDDAVLDFHDAATGAFSNKPLA